MGHIKEQYTLPNKAVRIIIRINPAVITAGTVMNLITDGTNCKNTTPTIQEVGINSLKSTKTAITANRRTIEKTTLITFRFF